MTSVKTIAIVRAIRNMRSAIGLNPVVAGDLTASRALENIEVRLVQLGIKYKYNWLQSHQN